MHDPLFRICESDQRCGATSLFANKGSFSKRKIVMSESDRAPKKCLTNRQKLNILAAYKASGKSQRAFARDRGLNSPNISKWLQDIDKIRAAPPDRPNVQRATHFAEEYAHVLQWAIDQVRQGLRINGNDVRRFVERDVPRLFLNVHGAASRSSTAWRIFRNIAPELRQHEIEADVGASLLLLSSQVPETNSEHIDADDNAANRPRAYTHQEFSTLFECTVDEVVEYVTLQRWDCRGIYTVCTI